MGKDDGMIPDLTNEQREELAKCFAEHCGVDERDESYKREMVGARKYIAELMKIWRFRNRLRKAEKK